MKKQQMIYIVVALFVVFAFLFMTVNTIYPGSFSGYQFRGGLGNNAGLFNEGFEEGARPVARPKNVHHKPSHNNKRKSGFEDREEGEREGFHGLEGSPMENEFQTIVPYLDDSRGPQCAGISNGVTATGGPLCLSEDQRTAFASRGMNSVVNSCKPIVNAQPYVYQGRM